MAARRLTRLALALQPRLAIAPRALPKRGWRSATFMSDSSSAAPAAAGAAAGVAAGAAAAAPAAETKKVLSVDHTKPVAKVEKTDAEWKALLGKQEYAILRQKATERAGTGPLTDNKVAGLYRCAGCNTPLYTSTSKFQAHCGWPAFDATIPGAVTELPDTDGHRVEIVCTACGGHLGHVFRGERYTATDTRHCVNSVSMKFEAGEVDPALTAATGTKAASGDRH